MKNYLFLVAASLLITSSIVCKQPNTSISQWMDHVQSNIYYKQLNNGLNILFYHLPTTKEVYLKMIYGVGSRDEEQYQHGLAHMIEHMIFKGTDTMSETDLQHIAQRFGNTFWNAYTSMDQTAYYFITDNKNWKIFLDIMADCMTNTAFKEHHFASEVKAVINELNMCRSNPQRKSIITALSSVFPLGHPYHHTTIGNREDLISASAEDLKTFYKKHYTPDKATLLVVGDLKHDDVFQTTEKLFSSIPNSHLSQKKTPDPRAYLPSDFTQQHLTLHTQTKQPHMVIYWKTPGRRSQETEVLGALKYILNQRLKPLKEHLDLAYTAQALHYPLFDGGIFGILIEPKTEDYAKKMLPISPNEQCRIFLMQQLADLQAHGPKDDELAQYKALYQNSFIEGFESCSDIADMLEDFVLHGNTREAFQRFNYVQTLSKNDLKICSAAYLTDNSAYSITCLPLRDQEKKEWLLVQKKIEEYEAELLQKKERMTTIEEPRLLHTLPQPEMIDFSFEKPDSETTLSNGMKVFIKERKHMPTVTMTCHYNNNELLNLHYASIKKSLIPSMACSQLLEESEGTIEHSDAFIKKEHTDFFHQHGAYCAFDGNGGTLSCLSDDFETLSKRFFHIVEKPMYPEQVFSRVAYNSIQSIIQNQENEKHLLQQELSHHLYKNYPWISTDQELIEEIKNYTKEDLVEFHKTYLKPHNLTLTIVGNIAPDKALSILENNTRDWQHDHQTVMQPDVIIPDITNPSPVELSVFLPKEQVMIAAGRLTTERGTDDQPALIIIERYINQQLFMVREQTGLFYYCHARLAPSSFNLKGLAKIVTQTNQCTAGHVIKEIQKVLNDIYDNGIPTDFIETAKRNQHFELAKSFSTNDALVNGYNYLINNNLSFSYYDDYLASASKLTPEMINQVAKKYCHPDQWTFVQVGSVTGHVNT